MLGESLLLLFIAFESSGHSLVLLLMPIFVFVCIRHAVHRCTLSLLSTFLGQVKEPLIEGVDSPLYLSQGLVSEDPLLILQLALEEVKLLLLPQLEVFLPRYLAKLRDELRLVLRVHGA